MLQYFVECDMISLRILQNKGDKIHMRNKMFKSGKKAITILMAGSLIFSNGAYTVSAAEIASDGTEINTELETDIKEHIESGKNIDAAVETEWKNNVDDIESELEENAETEIKKETEQSIDGKQKWNLDLGLEDLVTIDEEASMEYIAEIDEEASAEQKEGKETGNLKEKIVTIKGTKFVTDTFRGVKALYRAGGNDGSNTTYSCAAFVKRYYSQVYNVSVSNLLAGCTPISSKGTIRRVSSPKEGDIVATSSGSGNHWAIVKNVNNNGTITLIEQNWKWQQGGKTFARVNRKVKASACKIYRLKK